MRFKILISIFILTILFQFNIESFYNNNISNEVNSFNNDFNKEFNLNKINQNLFKNKYIFTANLGQLENDEIMFYAQNNAIWFTANGVWFELREYNEPRGWGSETRGQGGVKNELSISSQESRVDSLESRLMTDNYRLTTNEYKRVILKQEFVGTNLVRPLGRGRLSWNTNFFYGNDSEKWCTDVPNYREVFYKNIYDGIDLRYYSIENGLKYDFIVHPGAEIYDIKLKYEGAKKLEIDKNGDLKIITQLGNLTDGNLICYQQYNDNQYKIDGKFKLFNNSKYGFELLSEYDPNEILIIDPGLNVTLKYSTLIGGIENDHPHNVITDRDGNAVITGSTYSIDFPSTTGVFDNTYNSARDIFVCKLNAHGSNLIFSTFIGGNSSESAVCTLDDSENLYLAGGTSSADFPITIGAFDQVLNGTTDGFLMKLNNTGSSLIYSTYIGGTSTDGCGGKIILDKNNNAIVMGYTYSIDFPTTKGANDTTYNGNGDMVIFKFDFNNSKLIFSTFVGGNDREDQLSMAIDFQENIYISGHTQSFDFPTTPGAYDRTNNMTDIFISKLDQNCSKIVYSTFIGGTLSADFSWDIVVDNFGNAVITGLTYSSDFPTTPGAYDTSFNFGYDCFILKLNHNGTKLVFSTFIGGSTGCESGKGISIDSNGNIYVTGWTWSSDFPTTSDAFDQTYNGGLGYGDTFLLQLDHNGSKLKYSTYFGGTGGEFPDDLILDSFGNAYITGYTRSDDFPQTNRTYTTGYQRYDDFYIAKFSFYQYLNVTSISLLNNMVPTEQIYSRLGPYTFKINISDTLSLSDLEKVRLSLDPTGTNIQLLWNHDTGKFMEFYDPFDYITIDPSSSAYNDTWDKWSIDFNITFNWTYPHENLNSVQVYAISKQLSPSWLNVSDVYRVENDVVFTGELSVTGEEDQTILEYDLVGGGEHLNWTGFIPVYEGTVDLYPPADELDIMVSDTTGAFWIDSPGVGEPFNIETITPSITNTTGFEYVINLTGIPITSDNSTTKFRIKIDSDPVFFYDPTPDDHTWQDATVVYVGITVSDMSGGSVNGSSIEHCVSTDNGNTWGAWVSSGGSGSMKSMTVHGFAELKDGYTNLIKWRAKDSLGNGPVESESYQILVDTQSVFFSNPIPLSTQESSTGEVEVGITISDNTSGVNASTIKYSISTNTGTTWSSFKTIGGIQNGNNIDVKLNLIFPNGTDNRIRWSAYDIAWNGPTYSAEYIINVNIPTPPVIPEIKLISPVNNSKIFTTSVELNWEVINNYHPSIVFDIKLSTTDPPLNIIEQNYTGTKLIVDDLKNGETYYWTVIPRLNNINGTCISGIWSFTIDIRLPRVILKIPENNSVITSTLPTLAWSLEYDGIETVTYDVYFGTSIDPPLKHEKLTTTYFAIDNSLEDNFTYYWKIIPWVGEYQGSESEIWSFTMKLKEEKIPKFGIELDLNPNPLEIKPGEVRFVSAIVTNLGEVNDNFTVRINDVNDTNLNAEVYRQDTMEIEPGKNKEFLIMISIKDGTEPGFENISILAKSNLAEKYNLDVQDTQELTIKILEKDEEKDRGGTTSIFYFSILILIVILIIIFIIVLILVRKRASKKKVEVEETQDIIPEIPLESGTIPESTVVPLPVPVQQQDETLEE
jgi:hypothetical protein